MNFLMRLWTISIQNTNNQPLYYMFQMTLHGRVLLGYKLINILLHLVALDTCIVFDWFVIDCLLLLDGVESTQAETGFLLWSCLFYHSHMYPE